MPSAVVERAVGAIVEAASAYRAAFFLGLPRSAARARLFVALDALEVAQMAGPPPWVGPERPEATE